MLSGLSKRLVEGVRMKLEIVYLMEKTWLSIRCRFNVPAEGWALFPVAAEIRAFLFLSTPKRRFEVFRGFVTEKKLHNILLDKSPNQLR